MSVTAAMLEQLRRMVNEPDDGNGYDDDTLTDFLARYPLLDEQGEEPYTWNTATSPPTQDANEDWIATYDLHAAAARVWEEKATAWADKYYFSADGGMFNRNQAFDQMMQLARFHGARRSPRTVRAHVWPKPAADVHSWVANEAPAR